MAKKYGLPTFPIQDGMYLGERDRDEIQWLIDHGFLQSDLYTYKRVIRTSPSHYRLVQNADSRSGSPDTIISESTNVFELLEAQNIAYWYWYGNQEG